EDGRRNRNITGVQTCALPISMIQYSSGSTTTPRGVLLSHHNLLHNLAAIRPIWNGDEHAIGVYWLPPHHDMGLIGGVLSMLYAEIVRAPCRHRRYIVMLGEEC